MADGNGRHKHSKFLFVIKANALAGLFWLLLLFGLSFILLYLKYLQEGWSSASGFTASTWDIAWDHRKTNSSFILLICGCVTGLFLMWPAEELRDAGRLGRVIVVSAKGLFGYVLLVILMWGCYFQAIYRDGGTFVWAFGDGRPAVAVDHQLTEQELDRYLGNAFPNQNGQADSIPYSSLTRQEKNDFAATAAHAKVIAGLQAVEGMVFLFVLLIWAFLCVLINIYVMKLGRLSRKDRGTPAGVAAEMLMACCFSIVVLLPILAKLGLSENLKLGVASAFLAVATTVALWLPFIFALGVLFYNQVHLVIRMPFWHSIARKS